MGQGAEKYGILTIYKIRYMNGSKVKITERFSELLNATAFRIFLFLFFLLLSCWPYLSFIDTVSIGTIFLYLFGIWAVLIGALVLIGVAGGRSNDIKNNG